MRLTDEQRLEVEYKRGVNDGQHKLLKRLAKEINDVYGEPFLAKGFVRARSTRYGTLWLNIGERDAEFSEAGICVGAGSHIGPAVRITHTCKAGQVYGANEKDD